jgi:hypothetical protein
MRIQELRTWRMLAALHGAGANAGTTGFEGNKDCAGQRSPREETPGGRADGYFGSLVPRAILTAAPERSGDRRPPLRTQNYS